MIIQALVGWGAHAKDMVAIMIAILSIYYIYIYFCIHPYIHLTSSI